MILYYLDDFFIIFTLEVDVELYNRQFDQLYIDLGLNINHTKDILETIIDFLDIKLNSIRIQTRLPLDKLARARNSIKDLLNRATIPHRKLESAIEFLSFTTKIVISKRAFLRRLFNAIRRSITIIRITVDIRTDLL